MSDGTISWTMLRIQTNDDDENYVLRDNRRSRAVGLAYAQRGIVVYRVCDL